VKDSIRRWAVTEAKEGSRTIAMDPDLVLKWWSRYDATCAGETTCQALPTKATNEFCSYSSTVSISVMCGSTRTSNLGHHCDVPGGAGGSGGEGMVWRDGDLSGVEPLEGFDGVREPNRSGATALPPCAAS
jgi:hypothetical protein